MIYFIAYVSEGYPFGNRSKLKVCREEYETDIKTYDLASKKDGLLLRFVTMVKIFHKLKKRLIIVGNYAKNTIKNMRNVTSSKIMKILMII